MNEPRGYLGRCTVPTDAATAEQNTHNVSLVLAGQGCMQHGTFVPPATLPICAHSEPKPVRRAVSEIRIAFLYLYPRLTDLERTFQL